MPFSNAATFVITKRTCSRVSDAPNDRFAHLLFFFSLDLSPQNTNCYTCPFVLEWDDGDVRERKRGCIDPAIQATTIAEITPTGVLVVHVILLLGGNRNLTRVLAMGDFGLFGKGMESFRGQCLRRHNLITCHLRDLYLTFRLHPS